MIQNKNSIELTQEELLEMQIKALYIFDSNSRMTAINEPWASSSGQIKPAPKLHYGITLDGKSLFRFRHDLSPETIGQLEKFILEEAVAEAVADKANPLNACVLKQLGTFLSLLGSDKYIIGICYNFSNSIEKDETCGININHENINSLEIGEFDWLIEEINHCQPCYGFLEENKVVSVCRSVRKSESAHEAGAFTAEKYRGRGLAESVILNWAKAVQSKGLYPLYSTSYDNKASQRVAEKMGLDQFGYSFTFL